MCFGPTLISMLPSLPPGDWNEGRISLNTVSGRHHFARVTKAQLPDITHLWHSLQIDYCELQIRRKLRSNVYEAKSPQFDSTVIAKFARFRWETPYLDAETAAYQWIENVQTGPKFLGHLSEGDRVIGFILQRITDCWNATPGDLSL
ncbi:hypothetical protein V1515DRAFT_588762 [Lipomyces mesembrius]